MGNEKYHSIMFKLRLAFLAPFAFFMLVIIFILGVYYRKNAVRDMIDQLEYEDEIIAQSLEARIQNAEMSVNTVIIQLNEILGEDAMDDGGPHIDMSTQKSIYRCMINAFTTFNDGEQIMVVWNNGVTWYQNWTENYSMQEDGEEIYREMEGLGINKKGNWLRAVQSESRIKGEGYFFAKQYADIKTGKKLGYVVLKTRGVFDTAESVNSGRRFYLFDPYGSLIFTSETETRKEQDPVYAQDLKEDFVTQAKNQQQDTSLRRVINGRVVDKRWMMFSITDIGAELGGLNVTIASILIISLFIAVVIFLIISHVINRVIFPIQMLAGHMSGIRDALPTPIDVGQRKDEVGTLAACFNEMTERNRELVSLLLEEKRRQEQLKLSLLQSQIKPHFLYNTLDTIYCLVLMGKKEEGGRMTKLLSDYYRHVLSNGMDWVLLFEEIKYTGNYLQIQSIRYRDALDFEIYVDKQVENIKIPKLTLQPLVENAIYHGIKPLDRKGHIVLTATQKEEILYLRIKDDGVGFTKEKFLKVIGQESNWEESFGLRNVAERLHLYYGNQCELGLEETSQGTIILIRISITEEMLQ